MHLTNAEKYLVIDIGAGSSDVAIVDKTGIVRDQKNKCYYRIVTRINIKLPVISNIMDFRFFYIFGDTKPF